MKFPQHQPGISNFGFEPGELPWQRLEQVPQPLPRDLVQRILWIAVQLS